AHGALAHGAAARDDGAASLLLAHRAWAALAAGDPDAVRLALAALEDVRLLADADRHRAYELAARVLVVAGHERADGVVTALCATANAARTRAAAATLTAELALRQGRLDEAEGAARRALAYPAPFRGEALALLVSALVERGAFDDAHAALRSVDSTESLAASTPVSDTRALRVARARLALGEGDFERVLVEVSSGHWAALALAHLGRRAEAAAVADVALEAAERFGAPLAIAAALHARAVAEPDPALRAAMCERGLEFAEHGLEAVRLRLELGAALAYLGSRVEARDALRPALADADAAGAVPLSQRARRELVATGLRPRQAALEGAAALTPRQRQICELAAVGKGNRAIAQELFLSIKTVETHLAAGYRKLGVNTRAELAAELAA
ncbi:LuxR C-terminal-related transcriptional regulator, partial [Solirubrobacter phytolaccae]